MTLRTNYNSGASHSPHKQQLNHTSDEGDCLEEGEKNRQSIALGKGEGRVFRAVCYYGTTSLFIDQEASNDKLSIFINTLSNDYDNLLITNTEQFAVLSKQRVMFEGLFCTNGGFEFHNLLGQHLLWINSLPRPKTSWYSPLFPFLSSPPHKN